MITENQENSETKKSSRTPQELEDFLKKARERFNLAAEAEASFRTEALDDLKFSVGDQWPEDIKQQREEDGRPCLVTNRIAQHIRQVTNDQRQNRPSIKVHPVDDRADIETAKVRQGLMRNIEYISGADVAYDTAFEFAVRCGRGFFRVITDYASFDSFDQEILIKRIKNPFTVYMDPSSSEPDGSDAKWCFITEDLTEDEYKASYGESELAHSDWSSIGDNYPEWVRDSKVCRVAEYYYIEDTDVVLVMLSNGQVVYEHDLPEVLPPEITIEAKRKSRVPIVKWAKITALDILDETEVPSQWIPVIQVIGEDLDIDGKRVIQGIVRPAKDPQKMLNFWTSAKTEMIALAPRAPFIGVAGQFEGFETTWELANRKNIAFLEYNPVDIAGHPVPPPQRNAYEPPIMAISNAEVTAGEDIKATTGIYDASLGAQSNEKSGIAIQRRNQQAQTSNFHFIDNLTRSLRHAGRIINDMIPFIYDTERTARIIGDEGDEEIIKLNAPFDHKGKNVTYDMSIGKYDIVVETGPSYATKRQEAAAMMSDLIQAYPKLMDVAGDQLIKNLDIPGASEIAERLKKTLPPGIAEDDKNQKAPLPPEVQQQMTQMSQMIEGLTGQLNEANATLETKKMELESKERIEFAKLETQAAIKMADLEYKEAIMLLTEQIRELNQRQKLVGMNQPISDSNEMSPDQAPLEVNQQPTGGASPGLDMGV